MKSIDKNTTENQKIGHITAIISLGYTPCDS